MYEELSQVLPRTTFTKWAIAKGDSHTMKEPPCLYLEGKRALALSPTTHSLSWASTLYSIFPYFGEIRYTFPGIYYLVITPEGARRKKS